MSRPGLRVLAVDDEPPALDELAYLLRDDDRVGSVATAGDATEALRVLRDGDIDVVFLDIRLPGLDGLELARVLLRFAVPPLVVFVTAHDDRAVDAFELGAVDYLLKPLRAERLAESLRRVVAPRGAALRDPAPADPGRAGAQPAGAGLAGSGPPGSGPSGSGPSGSGRSGSGPSGSGPSGSGRSGSGRSGSGRSGSGRSGSGPSGSGPSGSGPSGSAPPGSAPPGSAPPGSAPPGGPERREDADEVIPVELAGRTTMLPRSAVRWVEAQGDYARLHTADGSHLVRVPLSVLAERWAEAGFVRIHRSYLVALPLIRELRLTGSGYVVRIGDRELPVSRRHTRELKDRLVSAAKAAWTRT